jgi:DNA-binding response OmpR family regulator
MDTKVLIVEDEATTRSLIEYKLRNSGYQVHSVSDGSIALEYLRTATVDIIILDLMMPLMSGKETLVELRKDPLHKDTPVIILTARTLEEDIVEGLALGADDFVRKPFSPNELVARVKTLLLRKQNAHNRTSG